MTRRSKKTAVSNDQHDPHLLSGLFMQAPAMIVMLRGPKHIIDLANPYYLQLTGRDDNIIGKPLADALPETKAQGFVELLDNVYKTGEPFIGNEILTKIGQPGDRDFMEIYCNFVYQPYKDAAGKVQGIFAHGVDVTDQVMARKQAEESEERLRQNEERFRVVSDNATTGLFIMDDHQHCTFMNPAAENITGFSLQEVLAADKPLHDIIHHTRPDGSHYPLQECPIDRALPERNRIPGEDTFVRPDGTFYPVAFMASPIIKDGRPAGTVIEVRDITKEKQAREDQERLVSVTEQRNNLLALNKAKDEFIALASHQLRTPATAVKQYIAMLMQEYAGPMTEDQLQFLQTAYDSNEQQLNIINELLKTAQLDSNNYKLNKRPHDISRIVREAAADMQTAFRLKGQRLALEGVDDSIEAIVDSTEIKLVFVNLIENASKYSHAGATIRVHVLAKAGQVEITVTDKGVGIAKADRERIFEKFTRVSNELSDTVSGSGLGLYWVKQIIELHGGTVKVSSAPGKGSAFTASLPLRPN